MAAENFGGSGADWPTYGGSFSQQRFSLLRQINTTNAARLRVAWSFEVPDAGTPDTTLETTPLVVRGSEAGLSGVAAIMFVTSPKGRVIALDAASGATLWQAAPPLRDPLKLCCALANRGVAFGRVADPAGGFDSRVYVAAPDARLWALSAADGTPVAGFGDGAGPGGSVTVADNTRGYSLTMAPLFIPSADIPRASSAPRRDIVIVGVAAGEFEGRGFMTAYDASTGALVWRFDTIPSPGDFGSETWPHGVSGPFADAYTRGGGAVWMTPTYDPATGRLFVAVGNPAPNLDGTHRAGDNLFTNCILALDVRTGRRVWHYQEVHHDLWDSDPASPPVLVEVQGRPAVAEAGKTGFLYILDRETGRPMFPCPETPVPSSGFVALDGTSEVTSPTQPVCDKGLNFVPLKRPGEVAPVPGLGADIQPIFTPPSQAFRPVAPGTFGGSEWSPVAYDPRQGLAFVSGVSAPFWFVPLPEPTPQTARYFLGGLPIPLVLQARGMITAMDVNAGRVRWQKETGWPLIAGAVATAGGVLFYGEGYPLVGAFVALDSSTGAEIFRYWTRGGVNSAPMTYQVGGKQYVTVGAGGDSHYLSRVDNLLVTFALDDEG